MQKLELLTLSQLGPRKRVVSCKPVICAWPHHDLVGVPLGNLRGLATGVQMQTEFYDRGNVLTLSFWVSSPHISAEPMRPSREGVLSRWLPANPLPRVESAYRKTKTWTALVRKTVWGSLSLQTAALLLLCLSGFIALASGFLASPAGDSLLTCQGDT